MTKEEWLFTKENETAQPIPDLPKLVANAVSKTSLTRGVILNKKLVRNATAENLAVIIAQWMMQGSSEKTIQKIMVRQKVEPAYAADLISRVKQAYDAYLTTPVARKSLSKKYRNQMIWGIFWFIVGLAVTIGTISAASDEGGTYFIMTGAILWGLFGLIYGLTGWVKYRGGAK